MSSVLGFLQEKYDTTPLSYEFEVNLTSIDGYVPRNKKCFCFPYNMIMLTTNQGSSICFKPELFDVLAPDNNSIHVNYHYILSASPKIYAYMGNYNNQTYYYREAITYTGFPQIACQCDTFKNWYALNKNSITTSYITKTLDLSMGMMSLLGGASKMGEAFNDYQNFDASTANMDLAETKDYINNLNKTYYQGKSKATSGAHGVFGSASSIAKQHAMIEDMKAKPSTIVGAPEGNELVFSGAIGIYISQETCRAEYIEAIDDFFTRFGYQVNTTKAITITNRENFDYVQTTDCNITGDIPQEDIEELEAIFDRGVTIWHNENTYGDWNVSNRGWGDIS